jgi:RNA polymerase sigma-70 factor (ECF subfamily)
LVRFAARLVGNVQDAEDVVQQSYLKAHRALVSGRFDRRSSVQTWLFRIVSNASIDLLRARTRRRTAHDIQPEPAWDGAASAEARVALRELDDWLTALPADQRAALILKSVEGLSAPEIATILRSSEGAVEQKLVRARATLRTKMRSEDD